MGSKRMKAWLKRIGIETKQNNIQNIKHAWAQKNKGPTSSKIVGDILTMSQTQIFKAEQRGEPQGKVNVCYFMRVQRQKTLKVGGRRDKGWVMLKTHRWPGVLFFFPYLFTGILRSNLGCSPKHPGATGRSKSERHDSKVLHLRLFH